MEPNTLKDSGARRSFGTGSVRDAATGKGCFYLLPWRAITLAARQMERGKAKYGERNWEKGQPLSSYLDSAMRHLVKHQHGWTDEPHLDAFVWNALCYAETAERIRLGILPGELDDRPMGVTEAEQGPAAADPRDVRIAELEQAIEDVAIGTRMTCVLCGKPMPCNCTESPDFDTNAK